MNKQTFDNIQATAKLIEEEGFEGLQSAIRLVGEEVTTAIFVTLLRDSLGARKTFPSDPEVNEAVYNCVKRFITIKP